MKTISAWEAKNAFGLLIDTARAGPVLIEKHGRGVVTVVFLTRRDSFAVTQLTRHLCLDGAKRTAKLRRLDRRNRRMTSPRSSRSDAGNRCRVGGPQG